MTERGFHAYEAADEKAEHYGTFATAEEAETVALKLGWEWVLVVRREVDDHGTITAETKRFYQPGIVTATEMKIAPLTEAEVKFFEEYERQMYSGKGRSE